TRPLGRNGRLPPPGARGAHHDPRSPKVCGVRRPPLSGLAQRLRHLGRCRTGHDRLTRAMGALSPPSEAPAVSQPHPAAHTGVADELLWDVSFALAQQHRGQFTEGGSLVYCDQAFPCPSDQLAACGLVAAERLCPRVTATATPKRFVVWLVRSRCRLEPRVRQRG